MSCFICKVSARVVRRGRNICIAHGGKKDDMKVLQQVLGRMEERKWEGGCVLRTQSAR
jgi:hypothetical protein